MDIDLGIYYVDYSRFLREFVVYSLRGYDMTSILKKKYIQEIKNGLYLCRCSNYISDNEFTLYLLIVVQGCLHESKP